MKVTVFADTNNTKPILDLLEEMGYTLPCNCHGAHHCNGKKYSFDCCFVPKEPIEITLPSDSQNICGIALESMPLTKGKGDTLLIDIGTSTIALALIQKSTGALRGTITFANPQKTFGADVIARIHASISGNSQALQECLKSALEKEAKNLCAKNNQDFEDISYCYIAGNTVMIHTLMGYDCNCLARSPFHIEKENPTTFPYHSCEVTILPWQSPFIGGDITAGIFSCGMLHQEEASLLIDLGTNGEMVLFHNNQLYLSATAAGPAFEGGGLTFGCPGIPGAIQHVRLKSYQHIVSTIGNTLPIGICGSGAISLCAELLRHHYVTKEGILTDKFPPEGISLGKTPEGTSILFTPEDYRNMQLAIASIAAGIDTLCHEAHISPKEIGSVFLAGGFGFFLDKEDGATLHLFSTLPLSHIHTVGNSCLQGLYLFATTDISPAISLSKQFISFAEHSYFKERFLEYLTY